MNSGQGWQPEEPGGWEWPAASSGWQFTREIRNMQICSLAPAMRAISSQ